MPGNIAAPVELLGRDVLSASSTQRQLWVEEAFRYWRAHGFPYPRLDKKDIEREFLRLKYVSPRDILRRDSILASTLGLRLANSFHPQMWRIPAHRHSRTPVDHFENDATLHKLLHRAAAFWPNRRCWNAQCIRSVFRIYGGGRVANFRPAAARGLIARYSAPRQTILDFSAGFGGRLLGCLTLERHYIGVDPAASQVAGLRRMVAALRQFSSSQCTIVHGCAEDYLPEIKPGTVDLVFSSPPYFNLEKYTTASNQSYRRYRTYRAWRQHFLLPVIQQSHRALHSGGRLVINVANTRDYSIALDLESIGRELFGQGRMLKLLMHTRPVQRADRHSQYRWEPVLVFRKRA